MTGMNWLRVGIATAALFLGTTAGAQAANPQLVARNLVQAGMVKAGDKVLISGSVRVELRRTWRPMIRR